MEFKMPLGFDPEKQESRGADVKVPDDLTQDEFWSMMLLMGTQLFGEQEALSERRLRSLWNPVVSLQNHIERLR